MGLAARQLEAEGFSTLVLTPMPEFNRDVGIPRSAAIAYPFGRLLGAVGDREGQLQVLRDALAVLEEEEHPGQVRHLPMAWPEAPEKADWHPPHISPIIKANLEAIKKMKV